MNEGETEVDNVYCGVCGTHYNRSRTTHVCDPNDLEMVFLEEEDQPDACNLNGDDLKALKREIEANGNPANLIRMWEASAGRSF